MPDPALTRRALLGGVAVGAMGAAQVKQAERVASGQRRIPNRNEFGFRIVNVIGQDADRGARQIRLANRLSQGLDEACATNHSYIRQAGPPTIVTCRYTVDELLDGFEYMADVLKAEVSAQLDREWGDVPTRALAFADANLLLDTGDGRLFGVGEPKFRAAVVCADLGMNLHRAVNVGLHEAGHAIGLGHTERGSFAFDIMDASGSVPQDAVARFEMDPYPSIYDESEMVDPEDDPAFVRGTKADDRAFQHVYEAAGGPEVFGRPLQGLARRHNGAPAFTQEFDRGLLFSMERGERPYAITGALHDKVQEAGGYQAVGNPMGPPSARGRQVTMDFAHAQGLTAPKAARAITLD